MGRPTELTDELSIEIAKHLIEGNSIADACALAGIAESTYHLWVQRGNAGEPGFSEFSELTRAARAEARAKCVKAIQGAAPKNWKAAAFFLERSDPEHWGRRDVVKAEHSGPDGGPIAIDVSTMTDDELRAIVEGKGRG